MKGRLILAAGLVLGACQSMHMREIPPIPDPSYAKGVSAPFCGIVQDVLVVAGGANFPGKPLLEGGEKKVYADIWCYTPEGWSHAGELPDSVAYGASFLAEDALILAGGNVKGKTSDKVWKLALSSGRAVVSPLPPLPVPMEQCGWSQEGENLYLAGKEGVFTCRAGAFQWHFLGKLPEPLLQPVLYAREGRLFLWGGFNPETLEVSDKGWCLEDGVWKEAPSIPDGGTFVGATAALLPDGRLAVVGGVNREVFARALRNTPEDRIPYLSQEPSWYRFRETVFLFDGTAWSRAVSHPFCALAGPGVAVGGKGLYVAGGEIKPGVRSPRIFQIVW